VLELGWDYPVYVATAEPVSEGTSVKAKREALSREEAIRAIAGKDPRPLLVLRECALCNKTDNALLSPGTDNDKTLFLVRWFHCVKLPVDVVQPDHPFNALFPSNDAEHLFVSAADGSGKIPLESDTARVELWSAMSKVLASAYVKDPAVAYKEVRPLLEKLDMLDRRVEELETAKAEVMESTAPDRSRLRKIDQELESAEKDIAAKNKEIARLTKIEPRKTSARSAATSTADR
jgi:hypothetical protein